MADDDSHIRNGCYSQIGPGYPNVKMTWHVRDEPMPERDYRRLLEILFGLHPKRQ